MNLMTLLETKVWQRTGDDRQRSIAMQASRPLRLEGELLFDSKPNGSHSACPVKPRAKLHKHNSYKHD